MTRKVKQSPIFCGLTSIAGFTWLLVANMASGQTAEAFYASDVDDCSGQVHHVPSIRWASRQHSIEIYSVGLG